MRYAGIMCFIRMALLPLVLSAIAAPAQAEGTAEEFLKWIDEGGERGQLAEFALNAYENGMGWANARLGSEERRALYCVPEKVALTSDQTVDILRRFLQEYPEMADLPAGSALLWALIQAFPCERP